MKPTKLSQPHSFAAALALLALAFLALGPGQTWAATSSVTYTNSTSWVCPAGVTSIQVECWGGGGAGGSAQKPSGANKTSGGGGGAGGCYARKASVPVTPGNSYTITIGPAATAPASGFTNNQVSAGGADTTFVGDSSTTVTAAGGAGGKCAFGQVPDFSAAGGAGSTNGCNGATIYAGGSGGTNATAGNSSGGGGGAGNAAAGGDAGTGILAGAGGTGGGGIGATGKTGAGNGNANNAAPGGGGGGARTGTTTSLGPWQGSAGAVGQIILSYTTPTYYATSGDATSTNNWWTVPGGSGTHPADFAQVGIFVIPSGVSMTLSGTWNVTSPEDTATMASGIDIQSGGSLACGNNNITGNVKFTLEGGGNLSLGSAAGISSTAATGNIQVTGTNSFSPTANYTYTGEGGSQVTGNQLPASVNNFTVPANVSVQLSQALAINGTLSLAAGSTFDVSTGAGGVCTFGSSASLTASGSSSASATLIAGVGNTVDFSTGTRTLTVNIADTTHPALNVSQGALGLTNAAIVVNKNGAQLPAATASYTLVSGTVSGTPATTAVTVGGSGLNTTGGYVAVVSAGTGQLVLNVAILTATTTTIALKSPWTSSSTYGDALVFHATVTSASASGTVTIKDGGVNGTPIGSGTLSSGAVDITLNPLNSLAVGTHTNIVAVYGGDTTYAPSTSSALASQTVGQYALTLTGASASNKLYDGTLNATLTGGTLSATVGGDAITAAGTFAGIGANQSITVIPTGSAAGNYTITLVSPGSLTADNLQAVAWTQTASGNNWSVAGNWQDSLVAAGSFITADFSTLDITADTTVHLDTSETINGLVFGNTDVAPAANWIVDNNAVAGNILTLAGTTPTITVNALGTGKSATIGAVIAGAVPLIKTGAGTLTLTKANTFGAGKTFELQNGALNINNSKALGSATTTFQIDGGTKIDNTSGASIVLSNNPPIIINGNFTYGGTDGLNMGKAYKDGGTVTLNGNYGVTCNGSAQLTISDTIGDGGHNYSFTKDGDGKLLLTEVNTFGGGLIIKNGSVRCFNNENVFGTGTITLGDPSTDANGAALLGSKGIFTNPITVIGNSNNYPLTIGGQGPTAIPVWAGAITLDPGTSPTLTISTLLQTGSTTNTTVSGGITGTGNLILDGTAAGVGPVITLSTNAINNVGTIVNQGGANAGTTTISAVIGANVTGVIQNSASSPLILSGANTYPGNTTVNAGLLAIEQPTLATNSTITVAGGATLQLDFSVTNPVAALVLNGASQPAGIYSSNTPAALGFLTGPGSLQVSGAVAPSTNALLSSLAITPAGALYPAFASNGNAYTATNIYPNNAVTVTATSADPNATLQLSFNGGAYTAPVTHTLSVPETLLPTPPTTNTVAVLVTAPNAAYTNLYTVNALLQPSQTAFQVTNSVVGTNLVLTWPLDHTGYRLLMQTNRLTNGVSGNLNDWTTVANSATTNSKTIAIIQTNQNGYYRLIYP